MKKYVLIKDVPFAEAGTELSVTELENCIPFAVFGGKTVSVSKEYVERLIEEEWIEEIKPREFYVAPFMGEKGTVRYKEVGKKKGYAGMFKVREVME